MNTIEQGNMTKENLIKKIREAVNDMESKVEFVVKGHKYQVKKTGKWLQGVSTVSSIIPKDWLSAWGAKECVKFLGYSDYNNTKVAQERMEQIALLHKNNDPKGYIKLLKEAKGACRRKSKTAMADGTKGHNWLETYVKAKMKGEKLPDIPDGLLTRACEQFVEWEQKSVDYWILSEAKVSYIEKDYAGTLDGLAMMKTGKLALIDFKFANHIGADYFLQTAGYQAPFEPYGIKIDERIILRLPKTSHKEEYDVKTYTYHMVENNIEIVMVPTNYEIDREVFFHCLPLKKWINVFLIK